MHNQIQMCYELIPQFVIYEWQNTKTSFIFNTPQNHGHTNKFNKL
jgi:hypothetical protein